MNSNVYNKLIDGKTALDFDEGGKPIPIIRIVKENGKYTAFNIKKTELKETFNSISEFLDAIGSTATRPSAFDDQTGEDIFWGR